MDCTWPKPITDRDLLAYLADEAPADITRHIKTCSVCREQVRDLRATEAWLRQTLYRVECPAAQIMSDFRQGFLASHEERAVAAHLQRCPHCRAELAQLDRFLADIEPGFGSRIASAVRVLVARVVTWPPPAATPRLAYGAVRGAPDRLTQALQAEEFQVVLDIEGDPTRPDRRRLQGLVTSEESLVDGIFADAVLAGARMATAVSPVDELGNFGFDALAPGFYALTLTGPGLELRVKEIVL